MRESLPQRPRHHPTAATLVLAAVMLAIGLEANPCQAADSALAHYRLAQKLAARGADDEAMAECRKAISLRPAMAAAHKELAALLAGKELFSEATAEYREALRLAPADASTHLALAVLLYRQRDFVAAADEYTKALRLRPHGDSIHQALGGTLVQEHDLAGAAREFQRALQLNPNSASALNGLGEVLARENRIDEAVGEFRAAVQLKPDYGLPHYNLGIASQMRGDLDGAIAEYRLARTFSPTLGPLRQNLAIALQARGEMAAASSEYEEAVRLLPDNEALRQALAALLMRQGDARGALAQYQQALRLNPASSRARLGAAMARKALGQRADALNDYREAVHLDPADADAHYALGLELASRGDEHDIAEFRLALVLRPGFAGAAENLGVALDRASHPNQAVVALQQAVSLAPANALAHANLGVALAHAGRWNDAAAEYRRALALNPSLSQGYSNLARALAALGDWKGEVQEAQAALRLDPKPAAPHLELGQALWEQGDKQDALNQFTVLLRMAPGSAQLHTAMCLTLTANQQLDRARPECQTALRLAPNNPLGLEAMGLYLDEARKFGEALTYFQGAAATSPKDASLQYDLALTMHLAGDPPEEVEPHLRQVLKQRPDYGIAELGLGVVLDDESEFQQAESVLQSATRLLPEDSDSHLDLSVELLENGEWEKSVAEYRKALKLAPDLALVPHREGMALQHGDLNAAMERALEELEQHPDFAAGKAGTGMALDKIEVSDAPAALPLFNSWNGPVQATAGAPAAFAGARQSSTNPLPQTTAASDGAVRMPSLLHPAFSPAVPASLKTPVPQAHSRPVRGDVEIRGSVRTLYGEPVADASVQLVPVMRRTQPELAHSSWNGDYSIHLTAAARHGQQSFTLVATAQGFAEARQSFEAQDLQPVLQFDFALNPDENNTKEGALRLEDLVETSAASLTAAAETKRFNPSQRDDFKTAARALAENRNPEQAITFLKGLLKDAPDCAACRTLMGLALLDQGGWSAARQELNQAAQLDARLAEGERAPQPFIAMAAMECWRGRPRAALFPLLQALEVNPKEPLALQELGRSLVMLQDWPAADHFLEKAINAGAHRDAYLLCGEALLALNKHEEADHQLALFLGNRNARDLPRAYRLRFSELEIRNHLESQEPGEQMVLSHSPADMVQSIPDLKGLQAPAPGDSLRSILRKTGMAVEEFFQGLPNTSSHEEVRQEILNRKGKPKSSQQQAFNYLMVAESGNSVTNLNEYRTDRGGGMAILRGTEKGFMLTQGFASISSIFLPQFQSESRFRLLGRQMVNGRLAHVVAFAQLPGMASRRGLFRTNAGTFYILLQGVAWIDAQTYSVMRMRTDLLSPIDEIALTQVSTDVQFAQVDFARQNKTFWLPHTVAVTVRWRGGNLRNWHTYSGFRFFNVDAREKWHALKRPPRADAAQN